MWNILIWTVLYIQMVIKWLSTSNQSLFQPFYVYSYTAVPSRFHTSQRDRTWVKAFCHEGTHRYPSASHGMAPLNTAGLHGARGEVPWRCRGCYRRDAEQGDEEGQRAGTQLALSWRDHSHEWGRASAELTQQATLGPGPAFSLSHAPHLLPQSPPLPGLGPAVLWDTTTQNRTSPLSPLTSDPPDHQALFTVNSNKELNGCS